MSVAKKAEPKKVIVFFSGRGSNMSALMQAAMAPAFPARITHAIANVEDAGGIKVAEAAGIPVSICAHSDFDDRQSHEEALSAIIEESQCDLICLAGYMRILSERFVEKYRGQILNIHPSLLPSFKGVDTHHRVLTQGFRMHGASVHFVSATLDDGPVIAQVAVPVINGDDDDILAARVLEAEHLLYPHALALVASGQARLSGGRVIFRLEGKRAPDPKQMLFSPPLVKS